MKSTVGRVYTEQGDPIGALGKVHSAVLSQRVPRRADPTIQSRNDCREVDQIQRDIRMRHFGSHC